MHGPRTQCGLIVSYSATLWPEPASGPLLVNTQLIKARPVGTIAPKAKALPNPPIQPPIVGLTYALASIMVRPIVFTSLSLRGEVQCVPME